MSMMPGAMDQMMQGPPPSQQEGALGNRATPPQRAIDKMMMDQQNAKQAMSFPLGIPQNEQPPQMAAQQVQPNANSFMAATLGRPGVK